MEEKITEIVTKPNPLTTVTTLSKSLAVILFVSLPFLGFYSGTEYQKLISPPSQFSTLNVPTEKPQPKISFSNLNQSTPSATSETANWKTYINSQYGFSFKYPSTMSLKTIEAAEDRDFLVMSNVNPPEPVDFSVALYEEHSPKSTLETQTLRFHEPNPSANPPIRVGEFSPITTTRVAGIIANTFTSNLCTQVEQNCTVYIVSHAGYIFKISTTESIKSNVADQILSTLRFN